MDKKDFNGDLGRALKEMIHNDTDCCEVTYTLGDMEITADITITKIVVANEVVYDAFEGEDEVLMNDDGEPILYS